MNALNVIKKAIYENTGLKICDDDLPFMCPNAEKTGDCLIYSTLDNCAKFEQCENDVIDYRYTVCAETEPVEERAVFCNHKKNIDFFEAFDFFNLEKYQLFDDYTKWALSEQYPRRGLNADYEKLIKKNNQLNSNAGGSEC